MKTVEIYCYWLWLFELLLWPCICRPGGRDNAVKLKAMNETVLRLNKANEQLQSENRALKDDLKNSIDGHERSTSSKSDVCLYNS